MEIFCRDYIPDHLRCLISISLSILISVEISLFLPLRNFRSTLFNYGFALQIPAPELKNQTNNLEKPVLTDGDWQTVNGTKHKFFVYSAFLDLRIKNNPHIRIIATTKMKNYDRVTCLFYFENIREFVPAKIRVSRLIEFLELNRLLGIDHFIFYNKSIGKETTCILNEYVSEGIISIHPWNWSLKSKVEIRIVNQLAALNDCLYRSMHAYSYILFADIDEFVVPRKNLTIPEMLRWLNDRVDISRISAYLFRNAFFYLQWEDDPIMKFSNGIDKHLITLRKTRRRVELNQYEVRSKLIVKPKNVMEVGIHFVWQFIHGQQTMNVRPDVAILHHYRVCELEGNDCSNLKSTVDHTVHHHRRSLTCEFARRWRSLSTKCSLPIIDSSSSYVDDNCYPTSLRI